MRLSDGYRGFQYIEKGKETIGVHGLTATGRWVYGTHLVFGNGKAEKFAICGYALDAKSRVVLPDSIGKSTGLMDCAGNLIFEDDVISSPVNGAAFIVEWSDKAAAFLARQIVNQKPMGTDDFELPFLCQLRIKEDAYQVSSNRFLFALQDSAAWNLSKDWNGSF
jgi:hypothetical protein